MDKALSIFLIWAFSANILFTQDIEFAHIPLEPTIPKNYDNEYYGITQIKQRQALVYQKSGKYLSVGFGGVEIKKNNGEKNYVSFPVAFLLKTGVQTFFNKNIGVRGFFALDGASGALDYKLGGNSNRSFYAIFSLGIDVIMEIPLSRSYKHFLGLFLGLGGGASFYVNSGDFNAFKNAIYTAGLLAEGGITLNMFVKHRVEIGVKALPSVKKILSNENLEMSLMPYVAYNYKF